MFEIFTPSDKSKFTKFAASIPREKVFEIIPLIKSKRIVLENCSLLSYRAAQYVHT